MQGCSLSAARARAFEFQKHELANPDNLDLENAARLFGRSIESILNDVEAGYLYVLDTGAAFDRAVYPRWQFEADPSRLANAIKPWRIARGSYWVMHGFFVRPNMQLMDTSPAEWILNPRLDMQRLMDLTTTRLFSDQGAG